MTETTDAQKLINAVEAEKNYRCYAHLRAIVDRKRAGVIIGKKGLCIQYLKTHYNVSVNLSRVALDQDWGRLVHIHGPHKHVTDAWKFRLKREENKDDEATSIGIHFILPDAFIQYLQYREQDSFMSIVRETNTEIIIKSDFLPRSTEHLVYISIPTLDQIHDFHKIIYLLTKYLEKHTGIALSFPGNSFYLQEEDDSPILEEIITNLKQSDTILHK